MVQPPHTCAMCVSEGGLTTGSSGPSAATGALVLRLNIKHGALPLDGLTASIARDGDVTAYQAHELTPEMPANILNLPDFQGAAGRGS
jgi:hypothetical protein